MLRFHQWRFSFHNSRGSVCNKTTEGAQFRPCQSSPFRKWDRCVATPSSTPKAPSSWPPRPASTILRPTCVADRVAPFQACSPSTPLGDRVVTPIMTSGTSSPMSSMAVTEGGGVGWGFRKGRVYILKRKCLYFESNGFIF